MGNLRKLIGARKTATRIVATDGTGDFESIQDAIDDLPTGGGEVYIKEGTYTITSAILIESSNVSLIGAGYATKIYLADGENHDCIAPYWYVENILIKDLQIDGNKANQTTYGYGIYFDNNVTYSRIEGCWIHDCYLGGINLDASSNNNTITGNQCNSNGEDGISMVTTCDNNTITGNQCNSNAYDGIYLNGSSNNTITGNQCNSNDVNGIELVVSSNNTITGNQCNSNVEHGIRIRTSDDNTIIGNVCKDNDVDNTITYDGIHLDASDNNVITGNRCQDNDRYEINISNATCDKNVVTNNICIGADHVGTINDAGTGTDVSHNITT